MGMSYYSCWLIGDLIAFHNYRKKEIEVFCSESWRGGTESEVKTAMAQEIFSSESDVVGCSEDPCSVGIEQCLTSIWTKVIQPWREPESHASVLLERVLGRRLKFAWKRQAAHADNTRSHLEASDQFSEPQWIDLRVVIGECYKDTPTSAGSEVPGKGGSRTHLTHIPNAFIGTVGLLNHRFSGVVRRCIIDNDYFKIRIATLQDRVKTVGQFASSIVRRYDNRDEGWGGGQGP